MTSQIRRSAFFGVVLMATAASAKDCIVTLHLARRSADGTTTQLASILPGFPYNASIPLPPGDSLVVSYGINSWSYCYGISISYRVERPPGCEPGSWNGGEILYTTGNEMPQVIFRDQGLILIRKDPAVSFCYAGSACIFLYDGPVGIADHLMDTPFEPRMLNGALLLGDNPAGILGVYDDLGRVIWSGNVSMRTPPLPINDEGELPAVITVVLATKTEHYARRLVTY